MMEFVKELQEARMLRNENNAKVLTYTDCCERMYLSLLCLELMRKFPMYNKWVKEYAQKTTKKSASYDTFSMFSTDLYNFIYFVDGSDDAINKLKDPGAAKRLAASVTLPAMALNRYLTQLANNSKPTSVAELFIKLESNLRISNADYKAIRRVATNWTTTGTTDKEKNLTRLAFAVRAKLRNSDIIEKFENFITEKDFEIDKVNDPEPTVSVPDISTDNRLHLYSYLVGKENLMMTRMFIQRAKDGNSVPSQYVQGYLPIVKMIDDIIQAGPAHLNALRVVHNRAKKARK